MRVGEACSEGERLRDTAIVPTWLRNPCGGPVEESAKQTCRFGNLRGGALVENLREAQPSQMKFLACLINCRTVPASTHFDSGSTYSKSYECFQS